MKRISGFSLIEITFGLLISSILSVMLFQVNGTLSRLSMSIESSLGYLRAIPLLVNQLERDIGAAYVPRQVYQLIEREFTQDNKKDQKDEKSVQASSPKMEKEDSNKKNDESAKDQDLLARWKSVEPFFCLVEDEQKLTLSVITTTSLPSFQRSVPRLVKVEYRITPDANMPGTFEVRRRQTYDIFDEQKDGETSAEGELVIDGIESLKVRMIGPAKRAEEAVAQTEEKPAGSEVQPVAASLSSEEATSWNKKDAQEKFASLLPLAVEFEGVLRSGPGGRTHTFIFSIPVAAAFGSMVELYELFLKKPKDKPKVPEALDLQKNKNGQK